MAGQPFNLRQPQAMGEIFFDKLGMPVVKKTATGASTDEEVLEKLAEDYPARQAAGAPQPESSSKAPTPTSSPNWPCHAPAACTPLRAGRGRHRPPSSNDPNLQNIPIRTALKAAACARPSSAPPAA